MNNRNDYYYMYYSFVGLQSKWLCLNRLNDVNCDNNRLNEVITCAKRKKTSFFFYKYKYVCHESVAELTNIIAGSFFPLDSLDATGTRCQIQMYNLNAIYEILLYINISWLFNNKMWIDTYQRFLFFVCVLCLYFMLDHLLSCDLSQIELTLGQFNAQKKKNWRSWQRVKTKHKEKKRKQTKYEKWLLVVLLFRNFEGQRWHILQIKFRYNLLAFYSTEGFNLIRINTFGTFLIAKCQSNFSHKMHLLHTISNDHTHQTHTHICTHAHQINTLLDIWTYHNFVRISFWWWR